MNRRLVVVVCAAFVIGFGAWRLITRLTAGSPPTHIGVAASNDPAALEADVIHHDLGQLLRGAIVRSVVLLRNGRAVPVNLRVGKKSCGCTAAELRTEVLAPQDTTALAVTLAAEKSPPTQQELARGGRWSHRTVRHSAERTARLLQPRYL
ncbi:MAG: DUF1573 domain-containing protein [Planctomycetes bacterium]|nr:DUF1573 domain-containing protein [Planctomycetota bacterium]